MQTLLVIIAVISCLCSGVTSCIYAYLAWKKSKEPPKDEAWEAAIKIFCANGVAIDSADLFVDLYEQLSLFTGPMGKVRHEELSALHDEVVRLRAARAVQAVPSGQGEQGEDCKQTQQRRI